MTSPEPALAASEPFADAVLTADQARSVQRAVGVLATWLAATTPDGLARHRATLSRVALEDDAAGEPANLTVGLVTLSAQLLTLVADLTSTGELEVLDAVAEAFTLVD